MRKSMLILLTSFSFVATSCNENTNKVHEAADVLYHLMVLLEANDIKIEDVMNELKKRQK